MSSVEDWDSPRPIAIPWLLFSSFTPPELSRARLAGLGQGWLLKAGVTVSTSASQAIGKYRVCVMQLGSVQHTEITDIRRPISNASVPPSLCRRKAPQSG